MSIRFFRNVRFKNDLELNFVGRKYNLRIGRSQFAFWIDSEPVFDFQDVVATSRNLISIGN